MKAQETTYVSSEKLIKIGQSKNAEKGTAEESIRL
jgi:hypothetical protein